MEEWGGRVWAVEVKCAFAVRAVLSAKCARNLTEGFLGALASYVGLWSDCCPGRLPFQRATKNLAVRYLWKPSGPVR